MKNEKRITVRTTEETHERIQQTADEKNRSLNAQVLEILATYYDVDRLRLRLAELERRH